MGENFTAEAWSLCAISLVFIAMRLYSRILTVGVHKLAADDYLMVIAGVRTLPLPALREGWGLTWDF